MAPRGMTVFFTEKHTSELSNSARVKSGALTEYPNYPMTHHTSSMSDPPPTTIARARNGDRLSRFVFTVNNYTDEEHRWLTTTWPASATKPSWLIVGKEVGENGTPHLQGACILGGQKAFSVIKTWPGFRRAHLEKMHGKPEDSKLYCSKEDLHPFEFGILPAPGKRSDLAYAVESIKEGKTMMQMTDEHGVEVVKFYKGLITLRSLRSLPRDPSNPPTIYWLYGSTGTGKTKRAWEFGTAYGGYSSIWISSGTTQWFDGYDGQRVAIFDDFRTKGTSFSFLLRITDRYPMSVPFKGGFVNWNPEIIIFTGPNSIMDTFEQRFTHRPEDVNQFIRRVTHSFQFPFDDAEFSNVIQSASVARNV